MTALEDHAATQTEGTIEAKGLTQKKEALRTKLLRDHMAKIARIARADLPNTPELSHLRMPRGKPTVERLKAAADGMARAAEPHAAVFIAAGMAADFIAQLSAAADALTTAVDDRTQIRTRSRGATVGLKAKLSEGRKVVSILDSFVQTALKDNAALLAQWNSVKRVPRLGGRSQGSASGTSGTSATTGSAATTSTASTTASNAPAPSGAAA
ncbi:MAG TPA: hypothetical protein VFF05_06465 [Rudaea sp.]|nr:hypothetical protein [Rudaea sp.]